MDQKEITQFKKSITITTPEERLIKDVEKSLVNFFSILIEIDQKNIKNNNGNKHI